MKAERGSGDEVGLGSDWRGRMREGKGELRCEERRREKRDLGVELGCTVGNVG